MIYSLKGRITAKEDNLAVIECGGVGYACRTTMNTLSALECDGKDVLLYTFMNVHEGGIELFGFFTKQELNCFKMLLSVKSCTLSLALSKADFETSATFFPISLNFDSKSFDSIFFSRIIYYFSLIASKVKSSLCSSSKTIS